MRIINVDEKCCYNCIYRDEKAQFMREQCYGCIFHDGKKNNFIPAKFDGPVYDPWVKINGPEDLPKGLSKIIDGETYYRALYVMQEGKTPLLGFYDEEDKMWFEATGTYSLGMALTSVKWWCDCLPAPPKEEK